MSSLGGIAAVFSSSCCSCMSCIFLLIVLAMFIWGGTSVAKVFVETAGGGSILSTVSS